MLASWTFAGAEGDCMQTISTQRTEHFFLDFAVGERELQLAMFDLLECKDLVTNRVA
jgi:hypothetical protein